MTASERAHILLVDDELDFGTAVATYLESWAEVVVATTATEGLRLLQQRCPDIVVVDQRLPDGDGLSLLRFARENCPETARVLITAYTEPDVLQEAINTLGIAYYIAKPVELPQLQLLLQQLWYTLLLRRSHRELQAQLQDYYRQLEERVAERTRTLQQAHAELQHLMALREQMLRFLLHDLKAPLANLQMLWGELTHALAGAADHLQELLTVGEDLIQTLQQLASDMLLVLTLESNTLPIRRETVDLRQLASRVIQRSDRLARSKTIKLHVRLDPKAPPLSGDPALLERLIANIVENALKYTPPGGDVTLSLTVREDALELSVSDTGVGMTAEDIAAALSGIGRPSTRPTGGEGSTGLGLQIIRTIARLHGAELSISSDGPGKGTTVCVRFPLQVATSAAVSQQ